MADKSLNNEELQELRRRLRARRLFLDLTYQQLADKTGMSKSTLQRYETGGIKNLPYDKILVLSKALEVPTNYFTDLDQDYTAPNEINDRNSPEARHDMMRQVREFEKLAIEHMSPVLLQQGYKLELEPRGSLGDIVATKSKESWHIDVMYIRDLIERKQHSITFHSFFMRMGRLVTYDGPLTKYSILFNMESSARELIDRYKLPHLNIDVSVLFLTDDGYEELFFQK